MTDEKMIKLVNKVNGLGGMTVNERLFACGLINEFDKVIKTDKEDKKVDIPLFEIFVPFKGTSFDKVLTGSDTNVRDDTSIKEKTTITYDFNLKKD